MHQFLIAHPVSSQREKKVLRFFFGRVCFPFFVKRAGFCCSLACLFPEVEREATSCRYCISPSFGHGLSVCCPRLVADLVDQVKGISRELKVFCGLFRYNISRARGASLRLERNHRACVCSSVALGRPPCSCTLCPLFRWLLAVLFLHRFRNGRRFCTTHMHASSVLRFHSGATSFVL